MNQLILYPTESGTYWRKPAEPNTGGWELCEVEFVEGPDVWIVRGIGYQSPPVRQDGSWEVYANQWFWYGPTLVLPPFEVKGFSKTDLEATRTPVQQDVQEEIFHGLANGVGSVQTDANAPTGFTASFGCGIE